MWLQGPASDAGFTNDIILIIKDAFGEQILGLMENSAESTVGIHIPSLPAVHFVIPGKHLVTHMIIAEPADTMTLQTPQPSLSSPRPPGPSWFCPFYGFGQTEKLLWCCVLPPQQPHTTTDLVSTVLYFPEHPRTEIAHCTALSDFQASTPTWQHLPFQG